MDSPHQHQPETTTLDTFQVNSWAPRPNAERLHHQHQKLTGDTKTNPRPSTAQGQLAYNSCLSDLDWREPIPAHTNTVSAGSAATPEPTQMPQSQPWMPLSNSNLIRHTKVDQVSKLRYI